MGVTVIRSNNISLSEDIIMECMSELDSTEDRDRLLDDMMMSRLQEINSNHNEGFSKSIDKLMSILEKNPNSYKDIARSINSIYNTSSILFNNLIDLYKRVQELDSPIRHIAKQPSRETRKD